MNSHDDYMPSFRPPAGRPISDRYLPSGDHRRPKPVNDPFRSAERVAWWVRLELLVGGRLNEDQRALAEYLRAGGHNLRQTHSLLVKSEMDQLVYQRRDSPRSWAFCEVLGTSATGMRVILLKRAQSSIVLGCDPRDVVTVDHPVHKDQRSMTWQYCSVAPGPRAGTLLVQLWPFFSGSFESAAKNVTTLREMIDAPTTASATTMAALHG
jgi:hypothetical protein